MKMDMIERIETFINDFYPIRNLRKKGVRHPWRPNRYWVKRAVRVLKVHRYYQEWVSFGAECAAPGSYDPDHLTETLEGFLNILEEVERENR